MNEHTIGKNAAAPILSADALQGIVLECLARLNEGRRPDDLLDVGPHAAIFGHGSRLDSLGLVTLLIEIEEQLASRGRAVTLADAHAMSQTRSPFRNVPALVQYLDSLIAPGP